MLRPKLLVIDTNVCVDYLLGTQPYCHDILSLFEKCARENISLLYAPTTLKDVFYIIPRQLRRMDANNDVAHDQSAREQIAWACVETITGIATAIPQALPECNLAWMLRHRHGDFEDNLIVAAAETCDADYVVTYDKTLIEHFAPVCITPEQASDLLD
ncbi:MAG: PIN domain-containing protein [Coriobacteriales bacterium]|nr:PIN domain-containing protein [Coriobacteriales bacterium]